MNSHKEIIKVQNLKKYFPVKSGILSRSVKFVKAVDDITINIETGKTFGLVGESGSGKSTLGKTILKLYNPTGGQIFFNDIDITKFNSSDIRPYRKKMQIIFQNPYGSLNPRMTVENIITEGLLIHGEIKNNDRRELAEELLEIVGLTQDSLAKYPHEFSGGQRQRIAIARAIAVKPDFLVADEPVSALDVSVQAQIINLLINLQDKYSLTYFFISHDLRVVRTISDIVAVMYLGKIVEMSESEEIYENPLHPYTKILISSVPDVKNKGNMRKSVIEGDVPNPIEPPSGCSFHPRCPLAKDICTKEIPKFEEKVDGHYVACHLV